MRIVGKSRIAIVCAVTLGSVATAFGANKPPVTPAPAPMPNDWSCRYIGSKRVCEFRLVDQVFFLTDKDFTKLQSFSERNKRLLQVKPNSPNGVR